MTTVSTIAHVELHDGTVGEISFRAGGGCRITLGGIFVYHCVEDDLFELWSHPAEILLTGLVETSIFEEIAEEDYVAGDDVLGPSGEKLRWKDLIEGSPMGEIRLAFPSGFRCSLRCKHADLLIGPKTERHQDWQGPLSTHGTLES